MTERLVLTSPETTPDLTAWEVLDLSLSRGVGGQAPTIKATVLSDTGKRYVVRYTPETDNVATILTGLRFINNGGFVTLGQTLQYWLLTRFAADGKLSPGAVSGSPD